METTISREYTRQFEPRAYLQSYYAAPDPEDRFIARCMISALETMPPDLLTLELAGGPTLYAVATLAPYSREIHFCDYLQVNLDEVQRWLGGDPTAYDWRPYIEMTLEEEQRPVTPTTVARRAADMRRKVTRLLTCNALAVDPLGCDTRKYDLVVSQASTDALSASIAEWKLVLRNIYRALVAPGGWLLISVLSGHHGYSVGEKSFPCLPLTVDDVRQGFIEAGFKPDTLQIESMVAPDSRDYTALISAVAQK